MTTIMTERDNTVAVVQRMIRHYKIPVTNDSIQIFLESHPLYPSLKSISDALKEWQIVNYPARLDRHDLKESGVPFIAHLGGEEEKWVFVPQLNDNTEIEFFDSYKNSKYLKKDDFFDLYSGVSILIEPDSESGEEHYLQKQQDKRLHQSLLFFAGFVLLLYTLHSFAQHKHEVNLTALFVGTALANLLGIIFSLLLVLKDLNFKTSLGDAFCSISEKTDCDSLLRKPVSKVFGWLHWSDIGLVYFLSNFCMILSVPNIGDYSLMALAAFCALGYVLFSIFYQAFVAKVWCTLCLAVQAILVAGAFLAYQYASDFLFSWISIFKYVSILGTSFFCVTLYKAYVVNKSVLQQERIEYVKLKKNPEIFINILRQGVRKSFFSCDKIFSINNEESSVVITAFLSMYCSSCKDAFNQLKLLLARKDVSLNIILAMPNDDLRPFINQLAHLFLENRDEAIHLLNLWYNSYDRSHLLEMSKKNNAPDEFYIIEQTHKECFISNKITGTPSIFINGYELPYQYEISDISFFMNLNFLNKI